VVIIPIGKELLVVAHKGEHQYGWLTSVKPPVQARFQPTGVKSDRKPYIADRKNQQKRIKRNYFAKKGCFFNL
jgi:hypothetical protein